MAPLTSSAISAASHLDKIATPLTNASARQGQEARSQSCCRPSSPCRFSTRRCHSALSVLSTCAIYFCSHICNPDCPRYCCWRCTTRSIFNPDRALCFDCSSTYPSRNSASTNNSACQCRRSAIRQTTYTTSVSISATPCRTITSISCSV